jgi:thiol-disulfide isomerase/thioredoxin
MQHISVAEKEELVNEALKNGISYAEYRTLVASHTASFTSTGHTQTEALSKYTELNDRRMRRWDKLSKLTASQIESIKKLKLNVNWLVLTESWCGDAAHTMPIMNKIAEQNDNINFSIVLRDDHPQLMDAFLTNNSKSIPKLIAQDAASGMVLYTWGPRPVPAAAMVVEFKKSYGTLPPEFKEDLQLWYNKDKGLATSHELIKQLAEIS